MLDLFNNMKILVVGLLPYESGKTTLARYLIEDAVDRGFDVGVSKPVSSTNGWYNYDCIVRSAKYGKLVGNDIYILHKASKSSEPIEFENPFVLLLMPPDPERIEWRSSAYTALSITEQIVLIRITTLKETKHIYIPSNAERITNTLREELDVLINRLDPKPINLTHENLNNLIFRSYIISDECLEYIVRNHEITVIESYSDAAAPNRKSLDSDFVIVVAPSKIAIYNGEMYKKALDVVANVKEPWLTKTEDVLPLLHPIKTVELKPFKRVDILDTLIRE